ncbi:MAG: hypothetical protein O9309_01285 [Rhizobium sp.]|nr:hypothetical protein [Rhizobium sp.]MCZ8350656.1 hypothetical protein [Rhizobium sp.]
MAKVRSPSYPSLSLKEAIEKVSNIFAQNYQSPIPRGVAATLMGYGGLNGKSLGVLAALSKYGLLEGRGDETRVSDLAVRIIAHEEGMPERAEAIREAASRPELFREIDARFNEGKASDAAIRAYLITQKFIPSAADSVIRTYRETKSLLRTESEVHLAPIAPLTPERSQAFVNEWLGREKNKSETPAPSDQTNHLDDDEPYEVSISGSFRSGKLISGRFSFRDQESVDELINVLTAMKIQLPLRVSDKE